MIAAAGKAIMIMVSSNFGIKSLLTIVNIPDIDIVVMDSEISPEMRQALEAHGIYVHIAPVENENST